MSTSNNKDNASSATNEKPPEPSASDVAKVSGQLVATLQGLPPTMQLRALGATATILGLDKEQRRSGSTQQQRTNTNNNSNQRSGGNR